jgi:hypothetical protein
VPVEAIRTLLRAIREEPGFAQQIAEAPSIMTGYDLTVEERELLLRRDLPALRELGVEEHLLPAVSVIGRPLD